MVIIRWVAEACFKLLHVNTNLFQDLWIENTVSRVSIHHLGLFIPTKFWLYQNQMIFIQQGNICNVWTLNYKTIKFVYFLY
jgi:hypothetical protein